MGAADGTDNPAPAETPEAGEDTARAQAVLSQALHVMAGGQRDARQSRPDHDAPGSGTAADGARSGSTSGLDSLTTTQLLLLAAIIGVVVGMIAGFVVVLV